MRRLGFLTACTLFALAGTGGVRADSECVKGRHDLIAKQQFIWKRPL
jgi:hypothetical protein